MDKNNSISDHPSHCYGCSSCEFICPKNAISLYADEKGFLYPQIDKEKCINCGLCLRACPINKENELKNQRIDNCYAIKNSDEIRRKSSSGGIYTALTDRIFDIGGVCIGAIYNEDFKVIYNIAYNKEERDNQRGSKYIQSYMSPVVLDNLLGIVRSHRSVIISGTPCQIAAIRSLLNIQKIDIANVLFIDIVCHGTPSPKIWREYLLEIERTHSSKIKSYTFRDKDKGWRGYHVRIELENGKVLEGTNETDSFVSMFKENLTLRDSCFSCPFASMERCGDITIGDFWGIEGIDASFSDNKGVSMVFANTEKGKKYLTMTMHDMEVKEFSSRVVTQPNLSMPSQVSFSYRRFWRVYKSKGYKGIRERFSQGGHLYPIYHLQLAIKLRLVQLRRQFL